MVFVLVWWFYLWSWWNKPNLQTFFLLTSFLRRSLGVYPTFFKPSSLVVKSRGSREGSIKEVILVWLVLSSQELWGYDQILYQVTQVNIPKELCVPRHREVFLCSWQLQMNALPGEIENKKQSFISLLSWSQVYSLLTSFSGHLLACFSFKSFSNQYNKVISLLRSLIEIALPGPRRLIGG